MCRSRHDHWRNTEAPTAGPPGCCRPWPRHGFTLPELVIALTILTLVSTVLGGLTLAVRTAWDYTQGLEQAQWQAQAALERIKYMISQAGTYRASGQPTNVGLAVVTHRWGSVNVPDTLVVWSGGRNGGMSAAGLQARLPLVSELVIYTPDPQNAARLVETVVPTDPNSIDFRAADFATRIESLRTSAARQSVMLCDRLRTDAPTSGATITASELWFDLIQSPSGSELSGVTVGSAAWNALPWAQGIVSGETGLRQATVRIELQLEPDPTQPKTDGAWSTALPFFAAASSRYVYQP